MNDENFKNGFILLSRSVLQSEIWINKPAEWLKIFIYILLKVNHKDEFFPRGSNFFNFSESVPPGTNKNQCYNFLKWAKNPKIQILTTQKTTRGVIVKVNNYNDYQN
ncbi:MAG: hypothetical protein LUH11_04110, partial [Candidatus Gastranaerophilales bacterium]|nr:hypothetical protein [Candidatus Gastranaerophilales bacterium]